MIRLIATDLDGTLLEKGGVYRRLWDAQQALENYGREAEQA